MQEYQNIIYIALAFIVFGLAIYLGVLLSQLKAQKQLIKEQSEQIAAEQANKLKETKESIRLIASATVQMKCDLSESCVRLANLMAPQEEFRSNEKLDSIFSMYAEIKHFPFLDERHELTSKERKEQDKVRMEIEKKYNDDYLIACEYLKKELKKEVSP